MRLDETYDLWYAYCDWESGHAIARGVAYYGHNPTAELQRFTRLDSAPDFEHLDFFRNSRIAAHRSFETAPRGRP